MIPFVDVLLISCPSIFTREKYRAYSEHGTAGRVLLFDDTHSFNGLLAGDRAATGTGGLILGENQALLLSEGSLALHTVHRSFFACLSDGLFLFNRDIDCPRLRVIIDVSSLLLCGHALQSAGRSFFLFDISGHVDASDLRVTEYLETDGTSLELVSNCVGDLLDPMNLLIFVLGPRICTFEFFCRIRFRIKFESVLDKGVGIQTFWKVSCACDEQFEVQVLLTNKLFDLFDQEFLW